MIGYFLGIVERLSLSSDRKEKQKSRTDGASFFSDTSPLLALIRAFGLIRGKSAISDR